MSDFDSPWKEALDVYFQPFLLLFFPDAHAEIDWSRGYQSLDNELQQITPEGELGRRVVDKLVKVWLKDGEEQWLLMHVEVQTFEEIGFARRMYVYNYRAFDRYNREVVSLAVLGDDNPRWRPERFNYGRWGCRAGIRFPVVKLLDYAPQTLEIDTNPFALVVLTHLETLQTRQAPEERHASKVRLIKGLLDRGLNADDVRQLFRLIDWMMDLPKPLDRLFWEEIKRYAEERQMPYVTTPERIGKEEGLSEGLSQGLAKGIEVALKLKFGNEGLQLLPEIHAIQEQEKLEAVLDAIPVAASPDDLRRIWSH